MIPHCIQRGFTSGSTIEIKLIDFSFIVALNIHHSKMKHPPYLQGYIQLYEQEIGIQIYRGFIRGTYLTKKLLCKPRR